MSAAPRYPRVAAFKNPDAFARHLETAGISLAFDRELTLPSPLGEPFRINGTRVGNRFCILPMEGWDGTAAAPIRISS
jgi:hypothetical protein